MIIKLIECFYIITMMKIKYKEFLKKIEDKNNELKKKVSEYKSKQQEVIKQLDELKNEKIK